MEKLATILENVAKQISATVPYVWAKASLFVWTEALVYVILIPVTLLVGSVVVRKASLAAMRYSEKNQEGMTTMYTFTAILVGGVTLGAAIALLVAWPTYVSTLWSPEGALVLRALGAAK